MATTAKTIGREWQQITDGTQSVLVQILGSADLCDSPVKPGEEQAAHNFSNTTLTITPPTVMWIRSSWFEGNIRVVVS
ncbi:hypothetical protein A2I42_08295 [Salmonella enterica]|uniref:Uncharacterized protein n=1 Tax=Salmonella enterica TaxID=28901 RepID=A0A402WB65_SALER|nr:hypothetical protein [Salmonella enterica]EBW8696409.1 hypothetical protein [Salmonella enterica subsp. diarizonae serovar 16:z10:e,n,x,z15]ECI0980185.1 hypothetical protein [Salmonella enterica subsp. enterica serovar Newport]EAA9125975.1 hypothetical protein [Salmonella enterica]EAM8740352.1 hypothetical protein [Salmonella enterica]